MLISLAVVAALVVVVALNVVVVGPTFVQMVNSYFTMKFKLPSIEQTVARGFHKWQYLNDFCT